MGAKGRYGNIAGDWTGENNPRWNGGVYTTSYGYIMLKCPEHPRANQLGQVFEHILVAEKTLGKYLPAGVVVHHINGKRDDNTPSNLLICESENYHKLIHRRKRALEACGHTDWFRCNICHGYGNPENMTINPKKDSIAVHKECNRVQQAKYRELKKINY